MKIGDIVYLKSHSNMMGEVEHISDEDTVTISICGTGLKITVDMADLGVTGSNQPHRAEESTVNILGTQYRILIVSEDDYRFSREADGWCDTQVKEILVFNYNQSVESVKDLEAYQRKVLRHEIIHAFLYESGLWQNAYGSKCWAQNEEMVDWIAIQFPKIYKAFEEAECND